MNNNRSPRHTHKDRSLIGAYLQIANWSMVCKCIITRLLCVHPSIHPIVVILLLTWNRCHYQLAYVIRIVSRTQMHIFFCNSYFIAEIHSHRKRINIRKKLQNCSSCANWIVWEILCRGLTNEKFLFAVFVADCEAWGGSRHSHVVTLWLWQG